MDKRKIIEWHQAFEAYIKIIRGINEEEIVKNTFKYRDYLNTMYQYQKLITELKNS